MKFLLEHQLPRKLRYARVFFQAGSASVSLSIDGANADWHASIGRGKRAVSLTDKEYSRLRKSLAAEELLDDDGKVIIIRNAAGEEEQWQKPQWVLNWVHRKPRAGD
jgi:hypothetical protein